MKILIFTTARSDWNGLGMVARALMATGRHEVPVVAMGHGGTFDEAWLKTIVADLNRTAKQRPWSGSGTTRPWEFHKAAEQSLQSERPDAALLAGDRYETLACALACATAGVPIVHLAGGDATLGSADDRYRNAITALASLHCTTNSWATNRLGMSPIIRVFDIYETGSPAIDRIVNTVPEEPSFIGDMKLSGGVCNIVLQVHPNTAGGLPSALEASVICTALRAMAPLPGNIVVIGACEDRGKDEVDAMLQHLSVGYSDASTWISNLPPAQYYWLLQNFHVMIGNSSAAYYEAPSFGLPCLDVGDRQKGRIMPDNVMHCAATVEGVVAGIRALLERGGPVRCRNLYGDGRSAERVVRAIEEHFCVARAA